MPWVRRGLRTGPVGSHIVAIREDDGGVVEQARANTWQVSDNRDAQCLQAIRWSDAGAE